VERLEAELSRLIAEGATLAVLLAFLGGIVTSLGPCNLSMVPVIMGYVGGQQELTKARGFRLSLAFTLGSTLTFVLLGLFAMLVRGLFGTEKQLLSWVVALVCFLMGLHLLGAIKLTFLDQLSRLQPTRVVATGLFGAFLLGLVVGLAGSQCATPLLAAIVAIAMKTGRMAHGAALLAAYGLGRGVPIVLAGTYTGVVRALPRMERWTMLAQKVAGVVLIGVGLYFLWVG
jgi:cytochrome c-type biogenesis protein